MTKDLSEIWQDVRNGDVAAMKSLYQTCYQELFVYGFRIIADKDKVKDGLHELFCEIWQKRDTIGDVAHVKAYLKTCIRNKLLREISQDKNFAPLEDHPDVLKLKEYSYEQLLITAQNDTEIKIKLQQALTKLTTMQSEVIRLKFFESLNYEAIALLLKLKPRTVYNHVFSALTVLRQEMKK